MRTVRWIHATPIAYLPLLFCLGVLTAFLSGGSVLPVGAQEEITLTATPSTIAPGNDLTISWTVPEDQAAAGDWIGFYEVGAANEAYETWDEFPFEGAFNTFGVPSGALTAQLPQSARTGQFEFRYLREDYTDVAKSDIVTVSGAAPPPETPTPSPTPPEEGYSLTVNVHADDVATIFLNGVEIGQQPEPPDFANFQDPADQFITTDPALFKAGVNTLEFAVADVGYGGSGLDYQAVVSTPNEQLTLKSGSGNAAVGSLDTANQFSLDDGASWQDAVVVDLIDVWSVIPETNWIYCAASNIDPCGLQKTIRYRITFELPSPSGQDYTLSASPSTAAFGGKITVNWTAPADHADNDWIALYKKENNNQTFIEFQRPPAGASSGSMTFSAPRTADPTTAGQYEFRYLPKDEYTDVARSNTVTLGPGYSVTASPSTVAQGGSITVNWTAPEGHPGDDWIALYKADDANESFQTYQYVPEGTSGSLTFTVPTTATAGQYEFRYLPHNGYIDVARSDSITVSD
jgi:hypothetical protein